MDIEIPTLASWPGVSGNDGNSSRASNIPEHNGMFRTSGGLIHYGQYRRGGILAVSGSLRSASSNSALVNAAARLAPDGVQVSVFHQLADIPPFNPDLDTDEAPAAVVGLRAAFDACDAILISSPEYAHGVSGVLKNALDWLVSSGELIDKPIALINASRRATHAHASLQETLTTMSGRVITDASITMALDGTGLDARGIADDGRFATLLKSALDVLAQSARSARAL